MAGVEKDKFIAGPDQSRCGAAEHLPRGQEVFLQKGLNILLRLIDAEDFIGLARHPAAIKQDRHLEAADLDALKAGSISAAERAGGLREGGAGHDLRGGKRRS